MDLSLEDLLSGLEAAQQKKTTVHLSDRNVVELVNKLKQLGFLGDELLHTSNGREYLTRDRLREEVAAALDAAGGRIPLVDLPALLVVDLAHCERAAAEVVGASKGGITQAQGELFSGAYFDALAAEVEEGLQQVGVVAVADLARRFALGMEMLSAALAARMGSALSGRLEGGVIYTEAYLARIKAQLRGALRGSLAPVSHPALRKDLGLEGFGALTALVPALIDELQKEGAVDGKAAGGGGSWVPAAYVRAQQDSVRTFYQQNGYVTFGMAAKHGVGNAAAFLAAAFGDGVSLDSAFVSQSVVSQVEAAVEEALLAGSWCDTQACLPSALSAADAAQLLERCQAAAAPAARLLAGSCVVAAPFLESVHVQLLQEARAAAEEAHKRRQAGAPAAAARAGGADGGGKGGKKGGRAAAAAVVVQEDDEDEEWDTGKGKGGKKGGKGGKKGKPAASAKQAAPAKGKPSAAAGAAPALSLDALTARVLELHPDLEGVGVEGELAAAVAAEVRPAAIAEYERALHDIFTAGADRRRRLREAAAARLDKCALRLQLHAKGAELFADDEAAAAVVHRHLLRTDGADCVDAVLRFLEADRAEAAATGDGAGGEALAPPEEVAAAAMTPAERARVVQELPPDLGPAVSAAVDALAAATPDEFYSALDAAGEAAGLRLRRLDKRTEVPLLQAQAASLAEQAAAATDAATLLAAAVPLLLAKHRARCASLPGRALASGVGALRGFLPEEQHALLAEFHAAVVGQLKAAPESGGGGELAARLEALVPRVKEVLAA